MATNINVAIIGGGPAGLSAGLYATRGGLKDVVLFEKGMPGGQITSSSEIENYPGVAQIMSGMDFMAPWQEQCFRFGLTHKMAEVKSVSRAGEDFEILLDNGEKYIAKAVIYAAGGSPKRSGIKGEAENWGKGVSTCATCDGFFYKNKEVALLGGGDTALEEAIFLTKMCAKVYLIHRRDEFRAAPSTVEHARANPKIEFLTSCVIDEIKGDNMGVTGVVVRSLKDDSVRELSVPGIFIFVGYDVNTAVLKDASGKMICECDEFGSIKVDLSMKTSVPGLYAAGDVRMAAPKQVVCAAADGTTAALQVISYLEHK